MKIPSTSNRRVRRSSRNRARERAAIIRELFPKRAPENYDILANIRETQANLYEREPQLNPLSTGVQPDIVVNRHEEERSNPKRAAEIAAYRHAERYGWDEEDRAALSALDAERRGRDEI